MAASGNVPQGMFASRSGLPTFGNFGNALLERGNPGVRKSTPDSEVLASSDEETDQSRMRSANRNRAIPNRRASLLADQNTEPARRSSFASAYSPATNSQPTTPGVQTDTWSAISPGTGGWPTSASSFAFGPTIWGPNTRDPPARLQEVRPDMGDSRASFSSAAQTPTAAPRSSSFSVGQNEISSPSTGYDNTRPSQSLARRTSRPGTLGHDFSAGLSRVNESDDPEHGRAAMVNSASGGRIPTRAMSSTTAHPGAAGLRGSRLRTSSTQDFHEVAVDDYDDASQMGHRQRNQPPRRMSDFQAATSARQHYSPLYGNGGFSNARANAHYISDFGQLDTIPQSRRHSFADVPTRRGSLGSNDEEDEHSLSYEAGSHTLSQELEQTYFQANADVRRDTEQAVRHLLQQEHHQAVYGVPNTYGYGPNASSIGAFHGPNPAPLYVVNFKCCRSEIFYVPENSGLSLKDGDLVIVEADRGTDLGCVQHSYVSWDEARKYKTKYAEQHFRWLMMFSQQTRSSAPNLFNPNAVNQGRNGPGQQGGSVRDGELKPKMIKRLAQAHEIAALQEKEGNEAKAKRVCQQKVAEHGLNMEILDGEFQMDGKKLTFFFFSNEYINFNSLVTDLFKMYKTRIWMSAINPASFQSPVSSMGLTPVYNNPGLGMTGSQPNMGGFDDGQEKHSYMPPNHQMSPGRALPQYFYGHGGYGQSPQMNEYGSMYATAQPGPSEVYSRYGNQQPYTGSNTQPRRESSSRHEPHTPNANSLAGQFGYMSLGRS